MATETTWLYYQISDLSPPQVPIVTEWLQQQGAVAIDMSASDDTPLFEPAPEQTPLWSHTTVRGLFAATTFDQQALTRTMPTSRPELNITIEPVSDQDWGCAWQQHVRPLVIADKLAIHPRHWPTAPQHHLPTVFLDAGLAFGTGSHPTTALCLRWLAQQQPVSTLLDYGTGSGILALAAHVLGNQQVVATDHDPQALLAAQHNRDAMAIDGTALAIHTPDDLPELTYEVIVANILANSLLALKDTFQAHLDPGGRVVLCGVLEEQVESLIQAYSDDFVCHPPVVQESWALITAVLR